MSKNIIITCGTSLINQKSEKACSDCKDFNKKLEENKDNIEEILNGEEKGDCEEDYNNLKEDLKEFLKKKYKLEKEKNDFSIFMQYSAEIKTIIKLKEDGIIEEEDKIFLISSDTLIGKLLAELIYEVLKDDYNFSKIENNEIIEGSLSIIDGFQVDDSQKFQQDGIKNYFKILDEIKDSETHPRSPSLEQVQFILSSEGQKMKTIMCPVGGYKSLIPYSSLYAMVNGWEIKYIYEDSDEILELPSGSLTNLTAKSLLQEKIDINEIFNKENLSNNYSFDLSLKLIFGIKNFIDYGKSKDLSKFFEELENIFIQNKNYGNEKQIMSKLKKYLGDLSDAFDLIRLNDIKDNICNILKIKVENIKDILLKNSIIFLQNKLKNVDIANIVDWYFKRQRYAETILIMREGIIDFIGRKLNINYIEREDREKITASLKLLNKKTKKDTNKYEYLSEIKEKELFKLFDGYEDFWDKLTEKRNNFAHTNQNTSLKTMKNGIIVLYKKYENIILSNPQS